MSSPQQLPAPLSRRAFTRAQLRASGIGPDRLRRNDIVALGSGTYAHSDLVTNADHQLLTRLRALALAREFPHAWLSHGTAAALLDRCAVPASCVDSLVHLSVPNTNDAIARQGVQCHRVRAAAHEVAQLPRMAGVRVSSPARLWRELAQVASVPELVALGDSLVREPYFWAEQRTDPYATIAELATVMECAGGFRGKQKAAKALPLIRVGADSAKESEFRMALLASGLPEPELQILLDPTDPGSRRGDLGFRRWKLVIQYEGKSHYTVQRHRADQRRDNDWVSEGWLVLRINVTDFHDGFATSLKQVRAALHSRGFPGGTHS